MPDITELNDVYGYKQRKAAVETAALDKEWEMFIIVFVRTQ